MLPPIGSVRVRLCVSVHVTVPSHYTRAIRLRRDGRRCIDCAAGTVSHDGYEHTIWVSAFAMHWRVLLCLRIL